MNDVRDITCHPFEQSKFMICPRSSPNITCQLFEGFFLEVLKIIGGVQRHRHNPGSLMQVLLHYSACSNQFPRFPRCIHHILPSINHFHHFFSKIRPFYDLVREVWKNDQDVSVRLVIIGFSTSQRWHCQFAPFL